MRVIDITSGRTVGSVALTVILLIAMAAGAGSATKTWLPTTGGVWGTAGNWSPSGAPAAGDDVIINSDQSGAITGHPAISLNSLTVSGNCNLQSSAGIGGSNLITVTGSFSVAAGKTLTLGIAGTGRTDFTLATGAVGTISGTVTLNTFTGFAFPRTFTVNGDLAIAEAGLVNGQAYAQFTLNSGATLRIANVAGIAASGATGAVQVPYTRTFSTGANYVYNGTAAQGTGTGLPATVNGLIIDNAVGVTLSASRSVSGPLTLTNGILATDSFVLTLGTGTGTLGTLSGGSSTSYIVGNFRRWVNTATGARLFPIGTTGAYRPVTIDYTSAPGTGGTLEATFIEGLPGTDGLPITDPAPIPQELDVVAQAGVWRLTAVTLAGGTYTISAVAGSFPNISNESTLRILKRPIGGSWVLEGSQGTNSGPASSPTVVRTGMSGFSEFGISSSSLNNPLPVQLASFTGAVVGNGAVRLDWRTISEVNNYGFYVQKKAAASTSWDELGFVPGHGTTNEPQNYTYTDYAGISGTTQYRLKQVDFDGTTFFTEPILVDLPTSVPEVAPKQFALMQNYPNPFNPSTEIKFSVENTGHATLVVYNSLGQQVATLFDGIAEAGRYNTVSFNAAGLSSGVYFYRLQSGQKSELKKLMLLK